MRGVCFNPTMRILDEHEISQLLATALVAHVAVVDGDVPYVGPLSFVYANGVLAFRTMDGRRLEAIKHNPAVSVEITDTGPGVADWTSVIIAGEASILDAANATTFVSRLVAKYRAAYGGSPPDWLTDDGAHVVVVTPTAISGRASDGTRPGRFEDPR